MGKPRARTVWLEQRGKLRPSATGPYLPAKATQYFTLDEPGFVWMVDASMFGIPLVGRDTLEHWYIPITAWKSFEGVTVPSAGGAQWKLASGPFDYFQWEVTSLKTNVILAS